MLGAAGGWWWYQRRGGRGHRPNRRGVGTWSVQGASPSFWIQRRYHLVNISIRFFKPLILLSKDKTTSEPTSWLHVRCKTARNVELGRRDGGDFHVCQGVFSDVYDRVSTRKSGRAKNKRYYTCRRQLVKLFQDSPSTPWYPFNPLTTEVNVQGH